MNERDTELSEWVSVAEAAVRLGADERTLRRLLQRPKNAAHIAGRTRQETRTTRTGDRVATVYPLSLVAELVNASRPEGNAPDIAQGGRLDDADTNAAETLIETQAQGSQDAAEPGQNADYTDNQNAGTDAVEPGAVLVVVPLTELIALKEAAAVSAQLTEALEHEREGHKRAQTLHLNTQGELQELRRRAQELEAANLRLIEAMPGVPDSAGQEPAQAPDSVPTGSSGQVQSPDTQEGHAESRPFWQRLFRTAR